MTFSLASLPGDLSWANDPLDWQVTHDQLTITTGPETDWFHSPDGTQRKRSAPVALFTPPDGAFMLSARVSVEFAATFDAGVLFLYSSDEVWAKLCFEYSPQGQPTVVSVVTRGTSDDCNSERIDGEEIYLRVAYQGNAIAFHFSHDGRYWHLVRHFALDTTENLAVGFSVQSPTGSGCTATFSHIAYSADRLNDIRSGE